MLMQQTRGKDAFVFVTTRPCLFAEKTNDTYHTCEIMFWQDTCAGERSVADKLGITR